MEQTGQKWWREFKMNENGTHVLMMRPDIWHRLKHSQSTEEPKGETPSLPASLRPNGGNLKTTRKIFTIFHRESSITSRPRRLSTQQPIISESEFVGVCARGELGAPTDDWRVRPHRRAPTERTSAQGFHAYANESYSPRKVSIFFWKLEKILLIGQCRLTLPSLYRISSIAVK